MHPHDWQRLLEQKYAGIDCFSRYDCCLHMVTAAIGAPEHYNTLTNAVRSESIDEASQLDHSLLDAWTHHPHRFIFSNDGSFEQKLNRVVECAFSFVGLKDSRSASAFRRRFFCEGNVTELPSNLDVAEFEVTVNFLYSSVDGRAWHGLRKRKQNISNDEQYTHISTTSNNSGEVFETRTDVGMKEYLDLLQQTDPTYMELVKHRRTFLYNEVYYRLDYYVICDFSVLTVFHPRNIEAHIPLKFKDVTELAEFSDRSLAKR